MLDSSTNEYEGKAYDVMSMSPLVKTSEHLQQTQRQNQRICDGGMLRRRGWRAMIVSVACSVLYAKASLMCVCSRRGRSG